MCVYMQHQTMPHAHRQCVTPYSQHKLVAATWVTASPPGPFDEVWQVVEQLERVVGISGDLCQRPHNQE